MVDAPFAGALREAAGGRVLSWHTQSTLSAHSPPHPRAYHDADSGAPAPHGAGPRQRVRSRSGTGASRRPRGSSSTPSGLAAAERTPAFAVGQRLASWPDRVSVAPGRRGAVIVCTRSRGGREGTGTGRGASRASDYVATPSSRFAAGGLGSRPCKRARFREGRVVTTFDADDLSRCGAPERRISGRGRTPARARPTTALRPRRTDAVGGDTR